MAIIFTQTDTDAQDGVLTACGSLGASVSTPQSTQMSEGAAGGTTEKTVAVGQNDASNAVAITMQSAPGEPGDTDWESGDWTIRLNVTTGNANLDVTEVHVCRIDSGGTVQETLGSLTGLSTTLSAAIHSWTVTANAADGTETDTDEVYISIAVQTTGGHGNQDVGITFDQDVDSPLAVAASFSGTITQTLGAITQSASGALSFSGTATQTLGAVTQDASGAVVGPVSGTATQTLPAVTQDVTGGLSFSATVTQTLGSVTQDASGSQGVSFTGDITNTLASVTQSATGGMSFSATLTQTLPSVTQDLSGGVAFSGTIDQSLSAITQDLSGSALGAATMDQTLGSMSQSMSASLKFPATGGSVLPSITQGAEQIVSTEVELALYPLLGRDRSSPINKATRDVGRSRHRGGTRRR